MILLWFVLLAAVLAAYAALDGFDFGVGILSPVVARTPRERELLHRTIGPVWDGNEVWLVAAGTTLFFAFPVLYARSFSGFYLPLIMVLWLLVFRALSIELRHHVHDARWTSFWDAWFMLASTLLAFMFGAALGNVVRGVSLSHDGKFFSALFTDFRVGADTGILDWYTILVGVAAVVVLAWHGATWLAYKLEAGTVVAVRATRAARRLHVAAVGLMSATTAATFAVQPQLAVNLRVRPLGAIVPVLAAGALVAWAVAARRGRWRAAFASSCTAVLAMVGSAAYGVYPYVLPGRGVHAGLTAVEAAAPTEGLTTALWWWLPGMTLAVAYTLFVYGRLPRTFAEDS